MTVCPCDNPFSIFIRCDGSSDAQISFFDINDWDFIFRTFRRKRNVKIPAQFFNNTVTGTYKGRGLACYRKTD